ncbi:MAG: 4'-phosphopantetheinyl transferase superfamily protein [Clostridiales bacterium]
MSQNLLIVYQQHQAALSQREARLCQWARAYGGAVGKEWPEMALPPRQPGCKPRFNGGGPCFSLSHSGDLWAAAFSLEEVGFDVERLRGVMAGSAIAKRYFHQEEQQWLGRRQEDFLAIWTAKEAVVKWQGRGIDQNFGSFSVIPALTLGLPVLLPEGRVLVRHFQPARGYIAALAAVKMGKILVKNGAGICYTNGIG